MKKTAGEKIMLAAQILLLAAAIVIWSIVGIRAWNEAHRELVIGVDYYPMANQHIEWTYALKPGE